MQEDQQTETQEQTTETQVEKKKSNKTFIIILSIGVGILVLYGVSTNFMRAASRKTSQEMVEEAIEQSTEGNVEVDISDQGEEVTVKTEEGTLQIGQQQIPENFPKDIPVYKGAQIISSVSSLEGVALVLSSEDSLTQVTDFYKTQLTEENWSIDSETEIQNATIFEISKDNRTGAVIINQTDEGTQVTLEIKESSGE